MKLSHCILLFVLSITTLAPYVYAQRQFHPIPLPHDVVGAEDLAWDCNGHGPYVGVSDGRILRWNGRFGGWTEFATTSPFRSRPLCDGKRDRPDLEPMCGRPLGLKFNPVTCELYIADAYHGLMRTPSTGGLAQPLATSAGGIPFRFLNGLDINPQTGVVYLTETSTVYQRRGWQQVIDTNDWTGRLMQYDPVTTRVSVLMNGVGFANGVTLSRDNSFLLVGETKTSTIFRFWLGGPRAYQHEVFAHLRAGPDNIKRNENGEFWVAIHDKQVGDHIGLKFNEQGGIIEVLTGGQGLTAISDIDEHNGALWTGSVLNAHVGVLF